MGRARDIANIINSNTFITPASASATYATIANFPSTSWTSWTPTLFQNGSIAITSNESLYIKIGSICIATLRFNANAAGTANNIFYVESLPIAPSRGAALVYGSGVLYDISTNTLYGGSWLGSDRSGTRGVIFQGDWATGGAWGNSPSLAIASGDRFFGHLIYEVS